MEKPYFALQEITRSDFASESLFEISKEVYETFLEPFCLLVNKKRSKQKKNFLQIVEKSLRSSKDKDLVINFNAKKAEESSLQEIFSEITKDEYLEIVNLLEGMANFFKTKSKTDDFFEKTILSSLHILTVIFYETIKSDDPESFHLKKKIWIIDFNNVLFKTRSRSY